MGRRSAVDATGAFKSTFNAPEMGAAAGCTTITLQVTPAFFARALSETMNDRSIEAIRAGGDAFMRFWPPISAAPTKTLPMLQPGDRSPLGASRFNS